MSMRRARVRSTPHRFTIARAWIMTCSSPPDAMDGTRRLMQVHYLVDSSVVQLPADGWSCRVFGPELNAIHQALRAIALQRGRRDSVSRSRAPRSRASDGQPARSRPGSRRSTVCDCGRRAPTMRATRHRVRLAPPATGLRDSPHLDDPTRFHAWRRVNVSAPIYTWIRQMAEQRHLRDPAHRQRRVRTPTPALDRLVIRMAVPDARQPHVDVQEVHRRCRRATETSAASAAVSMRARSSLVRRTAPLRRDEISGRGDVLVASARRGSAQLPADGPNKKAPSTPRRARRRAPWRDEASRMGANRGAHKSILAY